MWGDMGEQHGDVCARRGSFLDLIFSRTQSNQGVLGSTYGNPSVSIAKQKNPKGPKVTFSKLLLCRQRGIDSLVFHHFHEFESATPSLSWGATDTTNDPLMRPTAPSMTPSQLFRGPWREMSVFTILNVCAGRGSVPDLTFSCPQSSHGVLGSTYGYPSGSLAKQKSPKGHRVTFSNPF